MDLDYFGAAYRQDLVQDILLTEKIDSDIHNYQLCSDTSERDIKLLVEPATSPNCVNSQSLTGSAEIVALGPWTDVRIISLWLQKQNLCVWKETPHSERNTMPKGQRDVSAFEMPQT